MPPSTPANWELLKVLIADALELAPDQREPFLVEHCGSDPEMLAEARSLIAAYEDADGVIDRRTDAWLGLGGPDLLSLNGQKIGRYTLQRLLAEGAMAAVYVARQTNPQRFVALKLVRFSMPLLDAASRFKREAQALGRLHHPNIAQIYEAGVHQEGGLLAGRGHPMPFIAMELVDGPPLNVYARDNKLSREDRIRLMIKVAGAVHAAHQQAVIHRDLKPANVLVNSDGEPKVLDFGIARIINSNENQAMTWQTTAGVLLGTPGYMSPEQAAGKASDIDVRSDVWSLGVLLHELLTDRLPIEVRNTSIVEILKRIETAEPVPIGRFDKTLRGDLETIVMTSLAREKERRYASAQALADDLKRVLQYEPIAARAPTRWYRTKKFARRHRVGVGIFAAFLALVSAAAIVSSVAFVRASRERDRAQAISNFLQEIISTADPSVGSKDVTVVDALRAAEKRLSTSFAGDPLTEAEVRSTIGWTYFNLSLYDSAAEQLTRAIELRKQSEHGDDPASFDDQCRLATVLRWQYKPVEAQALARRAYDAAAKALGPRHPSVLALLDPLAGALQDTGDLPGAEREYRRAVELSKQVMGATNEQTMIAMNNLAVVLMEAGKPQEAEEIDRQLVAIRSRTLPPGSPSMITTRLNLAVCMSEAGHFIEAERELRSLTADAEKTLGPSHDSTLSVMSNHAEVLQRLGRFDEAIAIQKRTLERTSSRREGTVDDMVIKDTNNLASILNQAARFEEARTYAARALDMAIAQHGKQHVAVAICQGNLAGALDGLGEHEQAIQLCREAIAFYVAQYGAENTRTLVQQSNLGKCLMNAGRSKEALTILEATLAKVVEKKIASVEPHVRRHLGQAYLNEKRFADAEVQLLSSHEMSHQRGEIVADRKTVELLARLYDEWQRPQEASRFRAMLDQPATIPAPTTAPDPSS